MGCDYYIIKKLIFHYVTKKGKEKTIELEYSRRPKDWDGTYDELYDFLRNIKETQVVFEGCLSFDDYPLQDDSLLQEKYRYVTRGVVLRDDCERLEKIVKITFAIPR